MTTKPNPTQPKGYVRFNFVWSHLGEKKAATSSKTSPKKVPLIAFTFELHQPRYKMWPIVSLFHLLQGNFK